MGVMLVGSAGCWLGPTTVTCADAVPPFPASAEVTAPVTLFCAPAVVPTTFTTKEQETLAAKLAPARLTVFEPAAAVIVPPPQLPVRPLGDDTASPEGKASVKPIPLNEIVALGFDRLKVSVVVLFKDTLAAPNTFAIDGGKTVGGGLPEPDEPPPHAVFQSKLRATQRTSENGRRSPQNAEAVFQSSLLL